MADNFDMKQFLFENKLGAYSKLKENKFYSRDYVTQKYDDKAKEIEDNIHDEEDNNPNIWDLYTSLETADEVDNFVKGYMNEGKNFDLEVKWTPKYTQNPSLYYEKGLADDFETVNNKKVKEIVGYFENENGDEDFDVIGHIISKSGKDIETEYDIDDLDDAFMDALSKSNVNE